MEEYKQDIFYDISRLPLDKIKELLWESYRMSYYWRVDILKRIMRESIEMSIEDAMDKCDDETAYFFVQRRGYPNWEQRLEIGYRTMKSPDYFLWINLTVDKKEYFISKYNLELLV